MQARKFVLDDLNKAGKAARLRGFERISGVWLDAEAWSTDNDLVRSADRVGMPQLPCHIQPANAFKLLPSLLCQPLGCAVKIDEA